MKSKKAEELLENNSVWFTDNKKTQSLWVRNYIAEEAVKIAEEEVKEKAKKEFNLLLYEGKKLFSEFYEN